MTDAEHYSWSCTQVVASMSAYVDGEMGREEIHFISVHISGCVACGDEESAHRHVKALVVRAVRPVTAPVRLRARVETMFRARPQ